MREAHDNLIAGRWVAGEGNERLQIRSPLDNDELLADVSTASAAQVDQACQAAARAFANWQRVPAPERARVLFAYRAMLNEHCDELARLIVRENGKLLTEAVGSVKRGIEVVEFACGIPHQLKGQALQDVSRDVDSYFIREGIGVVAGIPPYNFPAMIPLWTMPLAVACGNAFVLKPAQKAPLTATRLAELFTQAGLPEGVLSVVQGGQEVSKQLISHPAVQAISFVGSSAVAAAVYKAAGEHGKRVQALGGAKNFLIVMPDADVARSIPAIVNSCFGSAGQRCLAGSVIIAVGSSAQQDRLVEALAASARQLRPGNGLEAATTLPPLISQQHRQRVLESIDRGVAEGARLLLDGRGLAVPEYPRGAFVGPTVFDALTPAMSLAQEEVFGPVVGVLRTADLPQAIAVANSTAYGNSASLFTQSGPAARIFRQAIHSGMLGINLGVPAPMAFFSFGGWKRSFMGDLAAHGPDGVNFYTRKKVVTERWFGAETPKDGWA